MTEPSYLQRARAESFGTIARDYDRFRPSYPDAIIDDLVALAPEAVLDVACGTGKATALLAARGLNVLGVEIDPEMAAVARGHGLDVEVGAFESWDAAGRRFDLITCAQAWHWIDPASGIDKAADLLNPGGTLVPFWNYGELDERTQQAMDEVYATVAPQLSRSGGGARGFHELERAHLPHLRESGRFAAIETRCHPWERDYSAVEWTDMLQTHSDHLQLEPDQRRRLVDALHKMIGEFGGVLHLRYSTFAIFARVAGENAWSC
ncbi:MAG TPA: class I SAM-dependent methyltransferase [Jatrophihabitantaceae bacterium]|nr:class I SAM-dependent methyltransferase [Jatrophihabitantaceae bacterium]